MNGLQRRRGAFPRGTPPRVNRVPAEPRPGLAPGLPLDQPRRAEEKGARRAAARASASTDLSPDRQTRQG